MDNTAVNAALDGLWKRFLPEMRERASVLESAAAAVAAGTLQAEEQAAARVAAHKLSGVLGTFGLAQGTELARELEGLFTGGRELVGDELMDRTKQLRVLIEGR